MRRYTFGRNIRFDQRSRKFAVIDIIKHKFPRTQYWPCKVWLDQKDVPACTGFSVSQEAAAEPVVVPNITNAIGLAVYARAKQLDQYAGEDYDGSSVLGAMKAAVERGWYEKDGGYRWAFGEKDLALAVSWVGPAVLGINWYEGMMRPDNTGAIRATGKRVGGHAILCNGYDVEMKAYRLHNSWGIAWGIRGDAFIHEDDLAGLLKTDGEACVPVIRKKGTA